MTTKKKAQDARRAVRPRVVGNGQARPVPLRSQAEEALNSYFGTLNGHRPGRLYELVMREVELPLFKSVMDYAEGNQSRAATILGINRGTLRKKLREYGLSG
jgi:Fis family transcriptional regulator